MGPGPRPGQPDRLGTDRLLPALVEGRADLAAANLTITPERLEQVGFSDPLLGNVKELVATRKGEPPLRTLEELAGREVHVRRSSSFHESLLELDAHLSQGGHEPMRIVAADERLESEDLLEMLNAGLIPATVVDSHRGEFWAQIFADIQLHTAAPLRQGAGIG